MSYLQTFHHLMRRLGASELASTINNVLGDALDRAFISSLTPTHENLIREELIRVGIIGQDTNVRAYLHQRILGEEEDIFGFLDAMNAVELADDTWCSSWEQHDRQEARRRANGLPRVSPPQVPHFREQVRLALREQRRRRMGRWSHHTRSTRVNRRGRS